VSDGITVTSVKGTEVEVFAISLCTIDGWAPHKTGPEGSLSCEPCRLREVARVAHLYGPREAS
jgi:hypothetical protein